MQGLGWRWVPTMHIGQGCKLSGHCAAVIDGVLHDTEDCSRDGTRCVYGYFNSLAVALANRSNDA